MKPTSCSCCHAVHHDHPNSGPAQPGRRLLITAGPTQEPIDAVRFIGNRSSGRLGVALADVAAARGWSVTLLLGPTPLTPVNPQVNTRRFRTTADLEALLTTYFPESDVLIMAAAVADYRPKPPAHHSDAAQGKLKRSESNLTLELEPTPDLLAACGRTRRPGQTLIGFALEPRERLLESAAAKVVRKGVDLIVANSLETMDAPTIEAHLVGPRGVEDRTTGSMSKDAFALWLLDRIEMRLRAGRTGAAPARP